MPLINKHPHLCLQLNLVAAQQPLNLRTRKWKFHKKTTLYLTVPEGSTAEEYIGRLESKNKVEMIKDVTDFCDGEWETCDDNAISSSPSS